MSLYPSRIANVTHVTLMLAAVLLAAVPAQTQAQLLLQAAAYSSPTLPPVTLSGSNGIVAAYYPDALAPVAQAHTLLTSQSASALGTGTAWNPSSGNSNTAFSSSSWHYRLWDPATNLPLDFFNAFSYSLQFHLRVTGSMRMTPDASSRATVTFSSTVHAYDNQVGWSVYDNYVDTSIVTYDSFNASYDVAGNASMFGNFDMRTVLYHDGGPEGTVTLSASVTASNGGESHANLLLESVTPMGGVWPGNRPISLRLDDGTIFPVTVAAVPEAPTWLMWCAAIGLAGGLRRSRQRFSC